MPSPSSEDALLLNRLADEFAERFRRGERPSLAEYTQKYPRLADEIRELFPALVEMERAEVERPAPKPGAPGRSAALPGRIGDFHILREVGRGGMGVVYEAEQVSLGRHVALKVLSERLRPEGKLRRRFEREARAAARLHHTNIVPVFGVGEDGGVPYYAMQFIRGLGLDAVVEEVKGLGERTAPTLSDPDRGEPPGTGRDVSAADLAHSLLTGEFRPAGPDDSGDPSGQESGSDVTLDAIAPLEEKAAAPAGGEARNAGTRVAPDPSSSLPAGPGRPGSGAGRWTYWHSVARVGEQAADALAYAHRQGVLHRDVKPSNLLLDLKGTVWVTDFGLAKLKDQQDLTETGDVLGTLRYLPPEAFEGRSDERSDVYALGLTLYEMLALRPAFDAEERHRLIKQVTTEEPPRLRRLNPQVPRDLEKVVHKAIEREPGRRYQGADELAEELRRFLADEPVKVRKPSAAERAWRWARRNRALASWVTAAVLLLVAGTAVSLYFAFEAEEGRLAAVQLSGENQGLYLKQKEVSGRLADALETAEVKTQEAQANEEAALRNLYRAQLFPIVQAWKDKDFGRLEDLLEEATPRPGQRDFRGWEWYYFLSQCRQARTVLEGSGRYVSVAAWCPQTRHLAAATEGGAVDIWDMSADERTVTLPCQDARILALAWEPGGKRLACAASDQRILIWDVANRRVIRTLPGAPPGHQSLAWSPDGQYLAFGRSDGTIQVWVTDTWSPHHLLPSINPRYQDWFVFDLSWHPDSARLASSHRYGYYAVWDVERKTRLYHRYCYTGSYVRCVSWSPDGSRLATGALSDEGDPNIVIWDDKGNTLRKIDVPASRSVTALTWGVDGKQIIAGGSDHRVTVWDSDLSRLTHQVLALNQSPEQLFSDPDKRRILTLHEKGVILLFPEKSRKDAVSSPSPRFGRVGTITAPPKGNHVVACTDDGLIVLFRPSTGRTTARMSMPLKLGCTSLIWNRRGDHLGAFNGGTDKMIVIWDVRNGKIVRQLQAERADGGFRDALSYSPDDRWLACASDKGIQIWDTATWQQVTNLPGRVGRSVDWSPDGRFLIASFRNSGQRGKLRSWRVGEWEEPLWETDLNQFDLSLQYSPDSRHVLLSGESGLVGVVELADEAPRVFEYRAHKDHTVSRWAPDGRRFATGSRDGTIKIWDAETKSVLVTLPVNVEVLSLDWSPDGRNLVVGCMDGLIRIYRAHPSMLGLEEEGEEWLPQSTERLWQEYIARAEAEAKANRPEVAVAAYEQAALLGAPADAYGVKLARACVASGKLARQQGDFAKAEELFRRAESQLRALERQSDPGSGEQREVLADLYHNWGQLSQTRVSEGARATEEVYRKAVALREAMLQAEPDNPKHHAGLGASLNNLAMLLRDHKRYGEARELVTRAVEHQQAALQADPGNPTYALFLRNHYSVLAHVLLPEGRYEEAIEAARRMSQVRPTLGADGYSAARILAECLTAIGADRRVEREQQQKWTEAAEEALVGLLRRAREQKVDVPAQLRRDPVFQPLLRRPGIQKLLAPGGSK